MLDLKSDKSIILGLGDLKLSDTEYTLNQNKMINGIYYKSIFSTLTWDKDYEPYDFLLSQLVVGDGRAGSEISKGKDTLFYGYGANRISSNASNIVLGILNNNYSYFIKEWFDSSTIYEEEPELKQRSVIRISDWKSQNAEQETFFTFNIYLQNLQIPKEAFEYWKTLEPKIVGLQEAFSEEQFHQLRLTKKR